MGITEIRREVEHAEYLAMHLSAHCTLFDGYYDTQGGVEQAQIDPNCFYTSWNEIYEKADELYGHLKKLVEKLYQKDEKKEGKENEQSH